MSDETTAVAEAPKPAATPRKTKANKPAVKKAAPKPSNNGTPRTRKEGLRLPQVRILGVLAKGKSLARGTIAGKISQTPGTPTAVGDALGVTDPDNRKRREKAAGFPSLLTLKYVREVTFDVDGKTETAYEITAAGRKAYEKAPKPGK